MRNRRPGHPDKATLFSASTAQLVGEADGRAQVRLREFPLASAPIDFAPR